MRLLVEPEIKNTTGIRLKPDSTGYPAKAGLHRLSG
jgi:hypothetical protein